jgi:galactan 5-O-arabinofuranosyltransferase
MLRESATTADRNFAFDTRTDPAYFLMWRTDMPGKVGQWPPPGELGGVGLFSILVFIGLAVCLWLGLRKPLVITIVLMFASAWVVRMFFASRMYETGTVQLWLRTDNQLLYCGLVLCALAAGLVVRHLMATGRFPHPQAAVIGAFCGLLMLFGSVSSSMSDKYMPTKENTYRILPWVSHTVRQLDGRCPRYAPNHECSAAGDQSWQGMLE